MTREEENGGNGTARGRGMRRINERWTGSWISLEPRAPQASEPRGTKDNKILHGDAADMLLSEARVTEEKKGIVAAFVSHRNATSNSADDFLCKEPVSDRKEPSTEPSTVNKVNAAFRKNIISDVNNQRTETECDSTLDWKKYKDVPELKTEQPETAPLPDLSNSRKQNSKAEYRFSQGFPLRGDSANPAIGSAKNIKIWNVIYQNMMHYRGSEAESSQSEVEEKNIDDDTVKLVQQAFDNILLEIPDNSSEEQSTGKEGGDEGRNTSEQEEENNLDQSTSKKWSQLKKVLLLRKFFNALENAKKERKEKFSPSDTASENEKINLRHQPGEYKKNSEDWMLDSALRLVISILAPSQRRKVASLVEAFETVIPEDLSMECPKPYTSSSSPRPSCQACPGSFSEKDIKSEGDCTSQNFLEAKSPINDSKNVEQTNGACFQEDGWTKKGKNQLSHCDESVSTDKKDVEESGKSELKGGGCFGLGTNNHKINLETNLVEDGITCQSGGIVSSEYRNPNLINDVTPSDRRKVAYIVQAFDTMLPSKSAGIPVSSPTTGTSRNLRNSNSTNSLETVTENPPTSSTGRIPSQNTMEGRAEDWNVNFDLCETTERDSPSSKRGFMPTWSSDEKSRKKQNDIWLWQMVQHHMVTSLEERDKTPRGAVREGKHFSDIGGENLYQGNRRFEASKSNAVRFVQQAFDMILSETPDQCLDNQSVSNDANSAEDPEGTRCEHHEEGISKSLRSTMDVGTKDTDELQQKDNRAITMNGKPDSNVENLNQKIPKRWSNLKKVILLRKFITSLKSLTSSSPRGSLYFPVEPNPDPESTHLRHLSPDERKKTDEWMLDYALRKVISTLGPSERRKVSLLAQAFDTVTVGSDDVVSPYMPAKPVSFFPFMNRESSPKLSFSSTLHKAESLQMNATKNFNSNSKLTTAEWSTYPETGLVNGEGVEGKPSKHLSDSVPEHSDSKHGKIDWSQVEGTRASKSGYPPQRIDLQPEISSKAKMLDKKFKTDLELLNEKLGNKNIAKENLLLDFRKQLHLGAREFNEFGNRGENCQKNVSAEGGSSRLSLKETKTNGAQTAGHSNILQNQRYTSLFGLICKQLATVDGNRPSLEGDTKKECSVQKKRIGEKKPVSQLVFRGESEDEFRNNIESEDDRINRYRQYQSEAVRLVEEAIDDISLSENPYGSYDGDEEASQGSSSMDPGNASVDICDIKNHEQKIMEGNENKRKPTRGKTWNDLKKLMILRKFVKTIEQVKMLKPHEPRQGTSDAEPGVEKVNLKHLDKQGGKDEYDWMLDSALQEVLAKLTPAQKTKVQLLIEAFESVGYQ